MTIPDRPGPTGKVAFDLPSKTTAEKARARRILTALYHAYPDAHCELDHDSPHQLLVAIFGKDFVCVNRIAEVAVSTRVHRCNTQREGQALIASGFEQFFFELLIRHAELVGNV